MNQPPGDLAFDVGPNEHGAEGVERTITAATGTLRCICPSIHGNGHRPRVPASVGPDVRLDAFQGTPFGIGDHWFSGHSRSPAAASTIRRLQGPNPGDR